MPIVYDESKANCSGVYVKCKGKNCKKTFEVKIKNGKGMQQGLKAIGKISGAAGYAVKMGSEFKAQMSRVQAISGATADELKSLSEQAKTLEANTAFSASKAAAGMENLASAGFDVNEIMSAMPGLLNLAAVSGGDVAMASEVAAGALNAFGLEADKAGHVADVFASAAADTT